MRTKTLLLTAALGAAGAITAMAQTPVYSVNMVGYVNAEIPQGYSMVSNPLSAADNSVPALFSSAPNDTTVFKFNPGTGGYDQMSKVDDVFEGTPLTLEPGEGVFVSAPSAFTQTFVGEVVLDSNITIPAGFSVISSVIPQAGLISSDLEYPAAEGDTIFQFNPTSGGYDSASFVDGAWEGAEGEPSIAVGEAFFISKENGGNWERHFTVGP
jgi:hypothetical protein